MMRAIKPRESERGVALLMMLWVVAVVSAVVTALLDDIRFGIRRTGNARDVSQAQWYALGAEELARQAIFRSWDFDPTKTSPDAPWFKNGITFPLDGGLIEGTIKDGGNCFNLNSLLDGGEGEGGALGASVPRPEAVRQYKALMEELGIEQVRHAALTDALIDWIDANAVARPQGAEDFDYLAEVPPYRPANTLLAEVAELKAVKGYDEEVYTTLRPFVCALPTTKLSPINVNTLTEDEIALLAMLTEREVPTARLSQVFEQRPDEGFRTIAQFWGLEPFAGLSLSEDVINQVTVRTEYFAITVRVYYYDSYVPMTALMEQRGGGAVRLVSRRFGEPL